VGSVALTPKRVKPDGLVSEIIREIYPTLTARRLPPSALRPKNSIYSFFAALWIIRLPCLVRLCPA
jgi:hypothetical protein